MLYTQVLPYLLVSTCKIVGDFKIVGWCLFTKQHGNKFFFNCAFKTLIDGCTSIILSKM